VAPYLRLLAVAGGGERLAANRLAGTCEMKEIFELSSATKGRAHRPRLVARSIVIVRALSGTRRNAPSQKDRVGS
jgi:hypothetical protein